ncbi:MAG: hypothetical protein ACFNNL_07425 [Kingella oralis]
MTRLLMTAALALSLAACQSPAAPTPVAPASSPAQKPAHAARENTNVLIIFVEQGKGDAGVAAVIQYGAEVVYRYQMINGIAIRVPAGKNVDAAMAHFERVRGVLQVQRDQVMQLH